MINHTLLLAAGDNTYLKDIKPDYGYLPWTGLLKHIVEGVISNALILVVIALVGAACAFAFSKLSSNSTIQRISFGVFIFMIIAAIIIGAAPQIVLWATSQQVTPK